MYSDRGTAGRGPLKAGTSNVDMSQSFRKHVQAGESEHAKWVVGVEIDASKAGWETRELPVGLSRPKPLLCL